MKYFTAQDIFLVTGATSGFGEGVVLNLLTQGATVVAVGRSQEKLTQLKAKLHDSKRLICENRDLVNTTKLDRWVVEVSKKYGRLKGLVLCAGTQQIDPLRAPMAVEKSRQLFELNYFANMQLAKGFCDLRAHVKSDASMVFISSIASIKGSPGLVGYASSKGAVNAAVKSLAVEVAHLGIRVNAVLPGFVVTNMNKALDQVYTPEFIEELDRSYPLGIGSVDSVVRPISFLLSDHAAWITGAELVVDGGASIC